jgi:hypothetical protein
MSINVLIFSLLVPALSDPQAIEPMPSPAPVDAAPASTEEMTSDPAEAGPARRPVKSPVASLPKADAVSGGMDGIALKGTQLAGCAGAYLLVGVISAVAAYIPIVGTCVGCVACMAMPAVYGATVTAVGNKFGNAQAPLLWPVVTMYVGGIASWVVSVAATAGLIVALGVNTSNVLTLDPTLIVTAFMVPAVVGIAIAVLGTLTTGVVSTFVWEANAEPKTRADQFELALVDMNDPFFGAKRSAPESATPPPTKAAPAPEAAPPLMGQRAQAF